MASQQPISQDRVALGQALEARAPEVAARIGRHSTAIPGFPEAVLATRLIGRWLATGQEATPEEHRTIARAGEGPVRGSCSLSDLAKAYLAWRDGTIELLEEAAARLGIAEGPLLAMARRVIRASCDTSLVLMMRRFDTTRHALESLLRTERVRLAHQALHDPLTALPNRLLLADRLAHAVEASRRRGQRVAVLFLDLDSFKSVNDRCGHLVGDQVLVTVADRLRAAVRPADTVARLGGDEFVVVAEDLDDPAAAAAEMAGRIAQIVSQPIRVDGHELVMTVSIGMALADADSDPADVLARADTAMYQAKRRSRGRRAHLAGIVA